MIRLAGGTPIERELRCGCHRLLACLDGSTLVLRCPRCKEETRLLLEAIASSPTPSTRSVARIELSRCSCRA